MGAVIPHCTVCRNPILMQIFKGTPYCCELCRKAIVEAAYKRQIEEDTGKILSEVRRALRRSRG